MTTILVVEDSDSNAQLVRVALQSRGFDVHIVRDGPTGLNAARDMRPDLMVVDLRLPGGDIDGWALIADLKNDPDYCHIPIIVTAVEITPEDRRRAFEAGCDRYFAKPYKIDELRSTVMELTGALS